MPTRRRTPLIAAASVVALAAATAVASPAGPEAIARRTEPPSGGPPPPPVPELSVGIARAVEFVIADQNSNWMIELARSFGARRWGITRFEGAVERYDQLEPTNQIRVWRRMIEPNSPVDPHHLTLLHEEDYMTGRALHCDRIALPPEYGAELTRAADRGGYWHTHAAMAIGILREIGCPLPISSRDADRIIEGMARIRDREQVVSDLALEAEAFLYWLGRRDLTEPRFLDRVRAAQNRDGSWGALDDDERWHGTCLGFFILSFAAEQTPRSEPWVAPVVRATIPTVEPASALAPE